MSDQPSVSRTFKGDFSDEDVYAYIDDQLVANRRFNTRGIRVSDSLYQRVIPGAHDGVPIAMDSALGPDDVVAIDFTAGQGVAPSDDEDEG